MHDQDQSVPPVLYHILHFPSLFTFPFPSSYDLRARRVDCHCYAMLCCRCFHCYSTVPARQFICRSPSLVSGVVVAVIWNVTLTACIERQHMKGASQILSTLASHTANNRSSRLCAHHQTQAHPNNISCCTSTHTTENYSQRMLCCCCYCYNCAHVLSALDRRALFCLNRSWAPYFHSMASSAAYARNAQITIVWLIAGCMRPSWVIFCSAAASIPFKPNAFSSIRRSRRASKKI